MQQIIILIQKNYNFAKPEFAGFTNARKMLTQLTWQQNITGCITIKPLHYVWTPKFLSLGRRSRRHCKPCKRRP
ncbi:MAG TPA: hypothetical protein DEQ30_09550, partial [Porphyromonadaceae bacterium]|nr:hypothetical protein [Porphyromonadaceae bacterium]